MPHSLAFFRIDWSGSMRFLYVAWLQNMAEKTGTVLIDLGKHFVFFILFLLKRTPNKILKTNIAMKWSLSIIIFESILAQGLF